MIRDLRIVPVLEDEWREVAAVRVGEPEVAGEGPASYVLAEDAGRRLRIDLFADRSRWIYVATEAIRWRGWIVVGFGYDVCLIDPVSRQVRTLPLAMYFSEFATGADYLIVASGIGLTRVDPAGEVVWCNEEVAVDGIRIDTISEGVISGDAEHDPPGDWRPFRVDLETGRQLA